MVQIDQPLKEVVLIRHGSGNAQDHGGIDLQQRHHDVEEHLGVHVRHLVADDQVLGIDASESVHKQNRALLIPYPKRNRVDQSIGSSLRRGHAECL